MEPLLLPISELAMGAQHDLQMPRQILFAEQLCNAGHTLPLIAGNLQQGRLSTRDPWPPRHFAENRTICRAKCVGFCPSAINRSTSVKTSSLEPCATCCMISSRMPEEAVPTNLRTDSAVSRPSLEAIAWSRMESASRIDPSPASASRASASSSA